MVNFRAFLKYLLDLFIGTVEFALGAIHLYVLENGPRKYHINVELAGLFHRLH